MTNTVFIAILFAVIAGLFIELFFQLIKYRDSLNKEGPHPITAYKTMIDASNYMSVSQYLSGGERRWINYFLFRLLPPTLILLLLSGVIRRYLEMPNIFPYLIIAAIISLIPRDILSLFKSRHISEKLLHAVNMLLILLLIPAIWIVNQTIDLSPIAPTPQGLIDNLWSSLIVAILVLLYLQATNMSARYQDRTAEDNALSNYVVMAYTRIKNKYDSAIRLSCKEYNCSLQILYAILIYEDMNRPANLRKFENLIVKLFRLNLTVGIAQVQSDKPLTDEESIHRAAKLLEGSAYIDGGIGNSLFDFKQLEDILKNYNSGKHYVESVSQIISKLRIYAVDIFQRGV